MESTERVLLAEWGREEAGFTLSDSMESTESYWFRRDTATGERFHPKRLDGEY